MFAWFDVERFVSGELPRVNNRDCREFPFFMAFWNHVFVSTLIYCHMSNRKWLKNSIVNCLLAWLLPVVISNRYDKLYSRGTLLCYIQAIFPLLCGFWSQVLITSLILTFGALFYNFEKVSIVFASRNTFYIDISI